MHSRSSTRTSNTIYRSKSSSSVRQRRHYPIQADSVDPETARIHALIAAHRAMDRSRAAISDTLERSGSTASKEAAQTVNRQRMKRNILLSPSNASGSIDNSLNQFATDTSEFGENYDAQPSSYRRLKKARSLLTPNVQKDHLRYIAPQTPFSQAHTLRHVASTIGTETSELKLRLKRSFQFLHPSRRFLPSPSTQTSQSTYHPEVIELARQQYLENKDEHAAREISSTVSSQKGQKIPRTFRQTLRGNAEEAQSPCSATSSRHGPLPIYAMQSISNSLRDKFKRVLSRSRHQMDVLPPQQLDASRLHFLTSLTDEAENTGFDSYHEGDIASLRRNSIYIPADQDIHTDAGNIDLANTNTSQNSFQSKSRVTSWTNSTLTGSTAESELNRKRLSVIKEDGSPHQPSSSAGKHIGGMPTSQQLFKVHNNVPINGQRLYSALVKHLDREEGEEAIKSNQSTIRPVYSPSPSFGIRAPDFEHRQSSIGSNPWQDQSGLAPENMDDVLAKRKQRLKQVELQSSFFPYSSEEQPETQSPFRRFLSDNGNQKNSSERDKRTGDQDLCFQGDRRQSGFEYHKHTMSSESVYSRTTHGGINLQYAQSSNSCLNIEDTALGKQREGFSELYQPQHFESQVTSTEHAVDGNEPIYNSRVESPIVTPHSGNTHLWSYAWEHDRLNTQDQCCNSIMQNSESRKSRLIRMLRPSRSIIQHETRISTPSSKVLETLSIPKKRSAPLKMTQESSFCTPVSKNNWNISTTQSGTLGEHNDQSSENEPLNTKSSNVNHLTRPFRKISPSNLITVIKDKRSVPQNETHPNSGKENRNQSSTQKDSSIDRVKASLSARLSRPFDMEIPQLNRPFDSMYLGKREVGYSDTSGGRLSVAAYANTANSPKGYGGLGTPVLDRFNKENEATALPHFPTPEDEGKKHNSTIGVAATSKRLVSNFLKSRRREDDVKESTRTEKRSNGLNEAKFTVSSSPIFL